MLPLSTRIYRHLIDHNDARDLKHLDYMMITKRTPKQYMDILLAIKPPKNLRLQRAIHSAYDVPVNIELDYMTLSYLKIPTKTKVHDY